MEWVTAFPIAAMTAQEFGPWLVRAVAIALVFGVIVFVHEAGHFVTARMAGMAVYEFSLGFGRPFLFGFKRGGTQYSVRLWPFISYVRIAGMEPGDDHPQGFDKKPRWVRALVLVMGCINNFLLAVVIFIILGLAIGKGVATNRIQEVKAGTPAAAVGLRVGDQLVGANGRTALSVEQIRKVISGSPGQQIALEVVRAGAPVTVQITPAPRTVLDLDGLNIVKQRVGQIGIAFDQKVVPMGVWEAVATGFDNTAFALQTQVAGILGMIRREIPANEVSGPVGVVHMLNEGAKASWYSFLSIAALLTVGIGFLNLLPLPPLDGSRLVILAVEGVLRRSFDKHRELVVNLVGIAVLLAFVLFLTVRDVHQWIARSGGG